MLTKVTMQYPYFAKLLCQYVRDQTADAEHDFPFTCITINSGFEGRLHRDRLNVGPSFIKAMGSFSGGELVYYTGDDGKVALDKLKQERRVHLNVRRQAMLFDGN